jgi:hypothetical protein
MQCNAAQYSAVRCIKKCAKNIVRLLSFCVSPQLESYLDAGEVAGAVLAVQVV